MALSVSTVLFFILSWGLWVAEARLLNSILTVPNGGRWGKWGPVQFCNGHAFGFQIKVEPNGMVEPYGMEVDATGLNAIALLCDNGEIITSTVGTWGIWENAQYCRRGRLVSFALKVQEARKGDNTAAEGILFRCSNDDELFAPENLRGLFGPMSYPCTRGSICGIQTRVQPPKYTKDDTALNDVRMYCCD